VVCCGCPDYFPCWRYCYVPRLQHWEWALVFRCFSQGETIPKEPAEGAGGKEAASTSPAPATLGVNLPEGATLTIDGHATASTSARRTFATPDLSLGKTYTYTPEATLMSEGKLRKLTRTVNVETGKETEINLDFAASAAAE
jgi:uncharacterized protein (TIGR03000 family)